MVSLLDLYISIMLHAEYQLLSARIYDESTKPHLPVKPGDLPAQSDPPLQIPSFLPATTAPNRQDRYLETPIYAGLT
jgi:hypothetical protein